MVSRFVAISLAFAPAVALASHPLPPLNLQQRNGGSGTPICAGCTTTQGIEVELTADSDPATCAVMDYWLEFEVRPVGTPFTGVPTHVSPTMQKPSCLQVTYPWTRITGLATGQAYHWQVREYTTYASGYSMFNAGATAFVVGPPPAYHLVFTTPPQTVGAGVCSAVTSLQRLDGSSAAAPVTSNSAVYLSDTLSYTTFHTDSACATNAVTQVTMPNGSSTVSFYWKSTRALNHTVVADMVDAQWAEQTETMIAGPPAAVLFVGTTTTINIKVCSAVKEARLVDAGGDPANVTSATTVNLTSNTGTSFYSDAACTAPITSLTFPIGVTSRTFYAKENQPGASTWTASSGTLTSATATQTAYAQLAITSAPQTIVAGNCAPLPITFETRDGTGAAYPVTARTTINISGTGMTFHSSSSCNGGGINSVNLSAGTSSAVLYWKGTWAGTPYITVSASYYYSASQPQTVNPGPPSLLAFTSGAQTITTGVCAYRTTVASEDAFNNLSPQAAAKVVTLSGSLPGTTFYSDSCITPLAGNQVTIAAGTSSTGFYWKSTGAGSLVITATAAGLTNGTLTNTVQPKFVFLTAPQTLTAGNCSAQINVQVQNATGAAVGVSGTTIVYLYTNSTGGQFFSDATCTTAITSTSINNGQSNTSFFYRDTRAGSSIVQLSATGVGYNTQTETIVAGPPAQLGFTTAAQFVGKTFCSDVTTVAQEDVYANLATQGTARTVNLSTSSGTMTFWANNTCTIPLTGNQLTIAAGTTSATFWFSDTVVGNPIITADSSPLTSTTQTETITLGAAVRLAFSVNGVQAVTAGACSAQVTLQSRNTYNNPENVIADVTVNLTSTSANGMFFSDATCTTQISSVTLLTGTNTRTFYWHDTTAGAPTLTASTPGMQPVSAVQTVNPGPAQRLDFTTAEQSVSANTCSAITTVQSADTYGNTSAVAGATLLLSSTSAGASFYSDAACTAGISQVTLPAGGSTASFYWKDSIRGTPTLTVTDQASVLAPASQTETVGGRDQVSFRWYSAAGAALAAERVAPELTPGAQVHLRLGILADSFTWRLALGDSVAVSETFANAETVTGNYLATQVDDTTYEVLTETKRGVGQSAYRTLGDATLAGTPYHVYSLGSGAAGGRPSYDLCIVAMTSGEALNVGWSPTSTVGTPTFPAGWQITTLGTPSETCFDLKAQGYAGGPLSIYLADALRGAGSDATIDTFTIDRVYVRGNAPTYLALERATLPDFSDAVAVPGAELWNDVANTNGALAPHLLLNSAVDEVFVESRPSLPANQQSVSPGQQAEWDFALVFPSAGGSHYYRMVLTDSAGTRTGLLETITEPALAHTAASKLAFTTPAQTVAAGSCSAATTVEREDPAGNPRPTPTNLTVNLSAAPAGATFYSDATCATPLPGGALTLPAGQAAATFYWSATAAGTFTLSAAATGLTTATQLETVTPGAPAILAFTTSPQSAMPNVCSAAATLEARDAYGNPSPLITAATVTLASNPAGLSFYELSACGGGAVTQVTIPAASSTVSFYFRGATTGSYVVTATAPFGSAQQTEQISAGPPTVLALSPAGQSVIAGACSATVTVQTQDSAGNPSNVSAATAVNLTAAPSTGFAFYSGAGCAGGAVSSVTVAAGTNSATFSFKGTAAGSVLVTGAATGFTSASQTETISPAAPTVVAFTSLAQTLTAGTCSGAATVETRDAFGNPSNVSANTSLGLAAVPGTGFTFFTAAGCATSTTTATVLAGTRTATFYFRGTAAGSVVVTVSSAGFTSGTQPETITAAAPSAVAFITPVRTVAAGVCSPAVTVQSRDAYGNVSAVSANTALGLSSSSAQNAFFSDAVCGTALPSLTLAAGASTATYYFRDTRAGNPVHGVTALGGATQTQTVTPGAASAVAFTSLPKTVTAGACSSAVTFEIHDGYGNVTSFAAATDVRVSSTSGGNGFFTNATCSTALPASGVAFGIGQTTGQYYFKDTAAGSPIHTLDAVAAGAGTATQTQTVNAAPANALVFATSSQSLVAGACSGAVTLRTIDPYGNLSAVGAAAPVNLSSTSVANSFFSNAGCGTPLAGNTLTIAAGTNSGTYYFRDTAAGSPTHTANGTAAGLGTVTQSHTIAPAAPSELRVTSAAQVLQAGQCSARVTVQVYDSLGNAAAMGGTAALSSDSVSLGFFQDAACSTTISSVTLSGSGGGSFYFRDMRAGMPHTTATLAGLAPGDQQQQINPAAPSVILFASTAQTLNAGACSAPVQLRLEDAYGNTSAVSSATALTLSSTSAQNAFYTDATCTTPLVSPQVPAASSTFTFHFRDTLAGGPVLTAQSTGFSSANQTETIRPAAAAALIVAGFPSPSVSDVAGNFTVTAQDAFTNRATSYAGTINFQSTDGAALLPSAFTFTPAQGGTATFQATLRTAGTWSLTATEIGGTGLSGTLANLQVVAGPAARLLVSGVSSPIVVGVAASAAVRVEDAAGNAAGGFNGTVHLSTTDSAATLPADHAFTPGDLGAYTFTGISFGTPGTQTVTATQVGMSLSGSQSGITVLQRQGGACSGGAMCGTGVCADAVCCDTTCTAACHSCDIPGSEGICSPEPNGTTCPDSTYCNGVEVCQAGACAAGPPVSCVDPLGDLPLSCDEAQRACVETGGVAPAVTHDASLTAAVGIAYRYNVEGRIHAVGIRPLTFASCGAPADARIDASSGDVAWTPASAGTLPFCVRATNAFGSDTYSFDVVVSTVSSADVPIARLTATPADGTSPLDVAFDSSASTVDPLATLLGALWDFGDGTPWMTGTTADNQFVLPGGVYSTLTVFDGYGRSGEARAGIRVRDDSGKAPPLARILSSATRGTDSLSVDFSCDCQIGDAPLLSYEWDFGDGSAIGATATHTFAPGRYHVRLTVIDQLSHSASDLVEIAVSRGAEQPPRCRAFALPPAGIAPLATRHRLSFGDDDGTVASAVLTFADGTTTTEVDTARNYASAGAYPARLLVTDSQGLTCLDSVQVVAMATPSAPIPPRFLTTAHPSASCGLEWRYSDDGPAVSGNGPFQWSLLPTAKAALPNGMTVDPSTGQAHWLPTSQDRGVHEAILRVTGPGGVSDQLLQITVTCGEPNQYVAAGCCSASGPGVAWIPVAVLLLFVLRRASRPRRSDPLER